MVQVIFAVRYISQLSRLRPTVIKKLEDEVRLALKEAGAVINRHDDLIIAELQETVVAFWLDLVIVLEHIATALAKSASELYGYVCLARERVLDEDSTKRLLRDLSVTAEGVGIWCDQQVAAALAQYVDFGEALTYKPIQSFHYRFENSTSGPNFWERPVVAEELAGVLKELATETGLALIGPRWVGKRQVLRTWAKSCLGTRPLLRFGFQEAGCGPASLADGIADRVEAFVSPALSEELRQAGSETLAAIQALRMAADLPSSLLEVFIIYLAAFVEAYGRLIRDTGSQPIVLLENIQWADESGASIIEQVFWPLNEAASWRILVTADNSDLAVLRKKPGLRIARLDKLTTQETNSFIQQFGSGDLALIDLTALGTEVQRGGLPAVYRSLIGWKQGRDGSLRSHPRVTADYLELAYVLGLSRRFFNWPTLRQLLVNQGKLAAGYDITIQALVHYGLLSSVDDQETVLSNFTAFAERRLGARIAQLRRTVYNCASDALGVGLLRPSVELLRSMKVLVVGLSDVPALSEKAWYEAIDADLGDEPGVEPAWLSEAYLAGAMDGQEAAELAAVAHGAQALRRANLSNRRTHFNQPYPERLLTPTRRASVMLDYAAEAYAMGDIETATTRSKAALLILQDRDTNRGLARAYRLLGACKLAKEKINESLDYFQFAIDSAERTDDWRESVIAAATAAAGEYLLGNLSKAERFAQIAERQGRQWYMENWRRWAVFFQARLKFEGGCYQASTELFETLIKTTGYQSQGESALTIKAWASRAKFFASNSSAGKQPVGVFSDAGLFAVEECYRTGDFRGAVAAAEQLLADSSDQPFVGPERVDWSSGFAMIEDRAIGICGGERVSRRLLRTYYALSLAALGAGPSAVEVLRKLTKDEKISALDPNEAFYFASYATVLTTAAASTLDQGTALGVAFKRLQQRASRIDDIATKRNYLKLNTGNAALLALAKQHNLI